MLTLALAAAPAVPASTQDEVPTSAVEKFKAMYPKATFGEIRKSQASGLYEVVMGENIAYTDKSDHYFILGHLFDMQQQVDLTAQHKLGSGKTEFLAQQLGQAIRMVRGDGGRILAVFNDPNCPYCKQLEGELARLDDMTTYTFLYPLESLHSEAKTRAVSM